MQLGMKYIYNSYYGNEIGRTLTQHVDLYVGIHRPHIAFCTHNRWSERKWFYFGYDNIQKMSQGLSADYVEVHIEVPCLGKLCSVGRGTKLDNSYRLASAFDMFDPALLAIAISRVMSPSGIYVMHEVSSEASRYDSQCHHYSWVTCFQFVIFPMSTVSQTVKMKSICFLMNVNKMLKTLSHQLQKCRPHPIIPLLLRIFF